MPPSTKYLLQPRGQFLYFGILFAAIGLLLLFLNAKHNNRYQWRPVKLPFRMEAGQILKSSFVAELDQYHEIEIEFQRNISKDKIKKFIISVEGPSPIDMPWKVLHKGKTVAEGTCRDYLYIMKTGDPLIQRILRKLLYIPYYQDIEGSDTVGRGVGKFLCKAGERYDIEAKIGTTLTELDATHPVFGVRVNRVFGTRHFRSMIPVAKGGFILLGLSLATFFWWGATRIYNKIRH